MAHQQPHPQHPYTTVVPSQVNAYAPTQMGAPAQTYPGHPGNGMPPAPQPAKGGGKRGLVIAVAAVLVLAVVGGGTAYTLLKDKDKETRSGSAPSKSGGSGKGSGTDSGSGSGSGSGQAAEQQPKVADYNGINLTAGYHLTLGEEPVRPQKGEDGGYELSYDTGGYLDAETTGGSLVLLDPGQEGSLETCRAETRFTESVYLEKISTGRQLCVTTGTGHLGLVTIKGLSGEDSPSKYMTLDLKVWRNAAVTGSGD